jgi:hypothetical protein
LNERERYIIKYNRAKDHIRQNERRIGPNGASVVEKLTNQNQLGKTEKDLLTVEASLYVLETELKRAPELNERNEKDRVAGRLKEESCKEREQYLQRRPITSNVKKRRKALLLELDPPVSLFIAAVSY